MALTGLHSLGTAYQTDLRTFLRKVESLFTLPYFDSAQPPLVTIGIGAQIDTESTYLAYVLQELGIDGLASESDPTQTANQVIKTAMDTVPNGSANNPTLRSTLNNALQTHFASLYGKTGTIKPNGTFELTEPQAYTVLDKIIAQKKPALDAKLAAYGIDATAMAGTREYLALTSLNFNTKAGATDLIGKGLRNAIANNDRAEAWFEIRYNSNRNQQDGLAKRRYYEAELFSLYGQNTPAAALDSENLGVFRMLTRHRTTIDIYEGRYGVKLNGTVGTRNMIAEGNSATQGYGLTGTAYEIDTLSASLQPARNYLVSHYAYNTNIDGNILVGEHNGQLSVVPVGPLDTTNTLYYRGADNDILLGSLNNDLIFGQNGNDLIYGLGGSDVLYGGAGNDTYYVINGLSLGANQTRIEDKEGVNTVVLNGVALKFFTKENGDTAWYTPDKRFKAEKSLTDLIVTDTREGYGNSVILNEDFQSGDFGIHLLERLPFTQTSPNTTPAQGPATAYDDITGNTAPDGSGTALYTVSGTPGDDTFDGLAGQRPNRGQ